MTKASPVTLVQKTDLTTGFAFNNTSKKFTIAPVSSDAGNVLTSGADGLASLTTANLQNNQITYTAALDSNTPPNLILYQTKNGTTTAVSTVAVGSSGADVHVTGGSYNASSGVLTLTESGTGNNVTINLGSFLTSLTSANSQSITGSGSGTAASPITFSLIVDTISGNLLKVSATGTKVDPGDVLALLNANIAVATGFDLTNGYFTTTVNGHTVNTNIVQFVGLDGSSLGYGFTGS